MISEDAGEFLMGSETVIEFMNRVELTRGKDDIIETTPDIIKHFTNGKGLGKALHFDYKGLHVCEYGKRPDLEKSLTMDLEQKLNPKNSLAERPE